MIWIIFLLLCIISIIEVFSASSTLVYKSGDHWGPITRHLIFFVIGGALVVFFHNIPYQWFQVFPPILLPLSAIFLILLLLFDDLNLGGILVIENVNNASRWVKLFGLQFQPSELAKMAVVIVTARILARNQGERGALPEAFKQILLIGGVMCLMIMPENYSTAVLLFATIFLMMFVGGVQLRKLLALGGGLMAVMVVFVAFLMVTPNETLREVPGGNRFETWKNRILDYARNDRVPAAKFDIDNDAQVGHARIALASSNILGKGPGNSVQRDFLSQAFSDFIFAIIVEELGLLGGAFVVFLYICLLVRVGRIARQCDRTFPAFLVLGIGLLLVIQALFNMMVAVGLAPVTGQPLPLVSRGGTSTIINCLYIGMILSVSRYTARLAEIKQHDAQIPLLVDTGNPDLPASSQGQIAAKPTSASLNSDAEFG